MLHILSQQERCLNTCTPFIMLWDVASRSWFTRVLLLQKSMPVWCPAGTQAATRRGEWISTAAWVQIVTLFHDRKEASLAGDPKEVGKKACSFFPLSLLPPVSVTDPRHVRALSVCHASMLTTSANDLPTISHLLRML